MKKLIITLYALLLPLAVWAEAKEPPGKIKNVLLIMSDDLKASALSAYGNNKSQPGTNIHVLPG